MSTICVGIGETVWDIFNESSTRSQQMRLPGGAPANFACTVQALGSTGIIVSSVGADLDGDALVEEIARRGLTNKYISRHDTLPTGTVTVSFSSGGEPDYTIHEPVAWDDLDLSADTLRLAGACDIVCFGTLAQRSKKSRKTIQQFLQAVSEQTIVIFDCNLRKHFYSPQTIEESLAHATVLKTNSREFSVLATMLKITGDALSILQTLTNRYNLACIAVTRAEHGSILYGEGFHISHPGYAAAVIDTVGAGDAFTAALALGLYHKRPPEEINDFANRIASWVSAHAGATPEIPVALRPSFLP